MKCSQCQTENSDGNKFRGECGAKLALYCPDCGSEVLAKDKFCGECGRKLQDQKTTAAPEPVDRSHPASYTPKHLAQKILTQRSAIQGERKLVTVLFADVAGLPL